jgi:ribonuclease VapC
MTEVLDASALLAYLQGEPGADVVSAAIGQGAVISTVNLAEVLSKRADAGDNPDVLSDRLVKAGLFDGAIEVLDLTFDDAVQIARLRTPTRPRGLSLGDRACLALGRRRSARVITADSEWKELAIGVEVRSIR